jgi:group I intron endonuclease
MSQMKMDSKNPMFGKTHSDATKELIRQSRLGKTHCEETKTLMSSSRGSLIYIYELNETFDFIATFVSIRKAAQFLNTSHSTISWCIKSGKFEFFKIFFYKKKILIFIFYRHIYIYMLNFV